MFDKDKKINYKMLEKKVGDTFSKIPELERASLYRILTYKVVKEKVSVCVIYI